MTEQVEIIRRIAERGLAKAQKNNDQEYIDLFQHLLDEISRLKNCQ